MGRHPALRRGVRIAHLDPFAVARLDLQLAAVRKGEQDRRVDRRGGPHAGARADDLHPLLARLAVIGILRLPIRIALRIALPRIGVALPGIRIV